MNLKKKSVDILKSLQLPNGGILATPLDGAYPYVYPRDAVFITKALNKAKQTKISERFYHFLATFSRLDQYEQIFHRYGKEGFPTVTRKDQHDNAGLVLHGIYDTYKHGKDQEIIEDLWPLIKKIGNLILSISKKGLVQTGTSIHELYRLEHGYEIWANCACCRGLYDGAEMASVLCYEKEKKQWGNKAKQIHKNIKSKLYNKRTGLYMKNTRFPKGVDITQSSPFLFELDNSTPLLRRTVNFLHKKLWYAEAGGFRRFQKFEICKDWHWYSGGDGGWTIYTAWMADFYKQLKDKTHYEICKKWLEKTATRSNGLFPEHVSTKAEFDMWKMNEIEFNQRILKGMKKSQSLNAHFKKKFNEDIVYWATPLGWSHAEYILLNGAK